MAVYGRWRLRIVLWPRAAECQGYITRWPRTWSILISPSIRISVNIQVVYRYYPELSHQYPIHNLINGRQEKDFGLQEWLVGFNYVQTLFHFADPKHLQVSKRRLQTCTNTAAADLETIWDRPLIWTVQFCWISLQYCEASKSTPDLRTTQAAAGQLVPDFPLPNDSVTPLTGFNNSWNHMAICIGKLRGSPRPSPPQLSKCPIRCVRGAWKYLSSAIFGNQVWACLLWCSRKTRGAANIDQLVSCLPNRVFFGQWMVIQSLSQSQYCIFLSGLWSHSPLAEKVQNAGWSSLHSFNLVCVFCFWHFLARPELPSLGPLPNSGVQTPRFLATCFHS